MFEHPNALPRAYRVRFAEAEPADPAAALARLASPDFDAKQSALLDGPPADLARGDRSAVVADAGDARIEVDEPEHQVIRTHGEQPGALVVTDSFFPGWEATLDGQAVPILRANTAFRAVAVPAGEHVVEMRYRPRPFRLGVALSLGTLVAGAACAVALVVRRRGST